MKLPKGYELGYVSSTPRTVILKGPYETLAGMSSVETENVYLTETDELVSRRVLIKKLPDFVSFAANQPFQVELSINVLSLAKDDYKELKKVPVRCLNHIPGIQMQAMGEDSVDIYLSNSSERSVAEISQPNLRILPCFF